MAGLSQLILLECTWWSRRCGRGSGDWKPIEVREKPLDWIVQIGDEQEEWVFSVLVCVDGLLYLGPMEVLLGLLGGLS